MEYKFKQYKSAKNKAIGMKKMYGYMPSVFEIQKGNYKRFVVVKPSGLKRVDKL